MPLPPKPPEVRRRRNKTSTAAKLKAPDSRRAPALPKGKDWLPPTRAWWRDIWRSPMSAEWLESDRHALYILADLINSYWQYPQVKVASEIRQQEQRFGLSPLDRRRLQWSIEKAKPPEEGQGVTSLDDYRAAIADG